MLIVDISNVMHSGMSCYPRPFLPEYNFTFRGIPYFFEKIAYYGLKSKNLVVVFDPEPSTKSNIQSPFKTNRIYNPQVQYELRVLKAILEFSGVPYVQVPGYSADSLISNILADNYYVPENHYIMSVDQDLACNVQRRQDDYTTNMLGFNIKGFNVSPDTFHSIYKVPYNFMNIHKLLRGCSSDAIPVGTCGEFLEKSFYSSLELIIELESDGVYSKIEELSEVLDPFDYNTEEYFFDWLLNVMGRQDLEEEYHIRAKAIFPKDISTGEVPETDWETFNAVIMYMFNNTTLTLNTQPTGVLTEDEKEELFDIITKTELVKSTIFNPDIDSDSIQFTSGNIDDLKLFDDGGMLL